MKFQSNEGIGVKFVGDADEEDPAVAGEVFEAIDLDDSQDIEGEDDGEEIENFTVENSYLEEKHTALSSLIRMAQKIPQHIQCKRFDININIGLLCLQCWKGLYIN